MPQKSVNAYAVASNTVTLNFDEAHGMSEGTYFSVRNIDSSINGQYEVLTVNNPTSISYQVDSIPDVSLTLTNGYIIYTSINSSGKPGFVYDSTSDTWYQLSAKVNTSGNYTWTGTHLYQAPVTMEDVTVLKNLSASPSASPSGGGYLYVENGELKFMGGNGTITTVAPA